MNVPALIIQLLSGIAGGNIAGSLLKKFSLGPIGNSIVGIIGGVLSGQLLGLGGAADAGLGLGGIVSNIAGGGVGGGVLMAIIGLIRGKMKKSA